MQKIALILAGGASSRLFPFNKLLSDFTGSGRTLIQQAAQRANALATKDHTYALAVKDLVAPIGRQLRLRPSHIFSDPVRRGTWPAILWAMAHLRQKNPQAVVAVLTGDHVIPNLGRFTKAAQKACRLAAERSAIVLLGVEPNRKPADWTGFGTFRISRSAAVTDFAEKPALETARRMIRRGGYHWNSGMFFFRIGTAEAALARFQPNMFQIYTRLAQAIAAGDTREAVKCFAEFPEKIPHPSDPGRLVDNTIDFAIISPMTNDECGPDSSFVTRHSSLTVLAVTGGLPHWADLGQWEALGELLKADRQGNVQVGVVESAPSVQHCILAADRGFSLDVRNLQHCIVAVAARGILIGPRAGLSHIKEWVAQTALGKFRVVNACQNVRIQRRGQRVVVDGAAFIR